ncbi:MAG: glycosyltransferase family 4 protein [Saprospiraceae bacterium]|nr:glycosyltransferase family 4 protein [Saprospiraceae bacterium]HMW37886.1 glycosyltransferase family 4 protein [Saprospiraceae bacterium]HMX87370.1 glycosyltransferase family 4 protein [Saprospiraceae bacterium]HMZ39197.1 glycosyltransferase family 4 protein [Saprospiraceae bacterium]HNA64150.1 glycosyltransferase family 4 protein [Saprospiraceae bacterium]
MSFKVLHIYDFHLPETMGWLRDSWAETADIVQHHFAPLFYATSNELINRQAIQFGYKSDYPVSTWNRIRSRWQQDKQELFLRQYIQSEKISLIHFHFGHLAVRFENFIRSCGLRCIVSLYGFDYSYLPKNKPDVIKSYQRLSAANVDFVTEGHYSKNLLRSYGVFEERIHVIQMFFKRAGQQALQPWSSTLKLLQVATITQKKGQLEFLEALVLSGQAKFFHIEFFGEKIDKDYAAEIEKFIRQNRLYGIQLQDKISFETYIRKMADCHIVVNLSRHAENGDSEGGCPVLIKDAMALGKPVLTTRHCDIPELAVNGFNAWVCKEGYVHEMAQNIKALSQLDSRRYYQFCNNAFQTAKDKTDTQWTRQGFLKLYLGNEAARHF